MHAAGLGMRETSVTEMWRQLVIDSLVRPRAAAQRVLALGFAPEALLQAAVAITCLGMVLGYLATRLTPGPVDALTAALLGEPLLGAALQLGVMAIVVGLTVHVGRMFGGSGGLWGALALVVWLNAVMLLIQAAQLVALVFAPPLAAMIAVVTLLWLLWAFANFVTELHGFQNPLIVLGATVLTMLVLFFVLAMLLTMLGVTPQEAG